MRKPTIPFTGNSLDRADQHSVSRERLRPGGYTFFSSARRKAETHELAMGRFCSGFTEVNRFTSVDWPARIDLAPVIRTANQALVENAHQAGR